MVNTIKFSEFKATTLDVAGNQVVGLVSGENSIASIQLGQAASKDVSDNTETKVASTQGAFTTGHVLIAADANGTVKDGGNPVGTGTVTQVDTGPGLTGGPINASGTISLAQIADNTFLANKAGFVDEPIPTALSTLLQSANNFSELASVPIALENIGQGSGLSLYINDADFSGGIYQIVNPFPKELFVTVGTPLLEVRLPAANQSTSPSIGQGIYINNFGSTESIEVAYPSGALLQSIDEDGKYFFSLQDNSSIDGIWEAYSEVDLVNGKTGIVILNSSDIDVDPVFIPSNYTPTDPTITGNLEGIDNALGVGTGISGTYVPIITNVVNATNIASYIGFYSANNSSPGTIVTCNVKFTFRPTNTVFTTYLRVSIPIGAAFTTVFQALGSGVASVNGAPAIGDGLVYDITSSPVLTKIDVFILQAQSGIDYLVTLNFQYIIQ